MANRIKRLRMEKARMEREALFRKLLAEQKQKAKKVKLTPTVAHQLEAVEYRFDAVPLPLRKKRIAILCEAIKKFIELPRGKQKDLYSGVAKTEVVREVLANKGMRKIIDHKLFRVIENIIHTCEIVRPLSEWKAPNTSDPYRLCWSFFEHTCVKYPDQMPPCLKKTFYYDGTHSMSVYDKEKGEWVCKYPYLNMVYHFAQGGGLHDYEDAYKYTGRMNFFFNNLPKNVEYPDLGIRWAAVASWGIPNEHIRLLIRHWSKGQVMQSEKLFRFLARQENISLNIMQRIIEFYDNQNFCNAWVLGKEIEPMFPGFSFSKRTLKSVMRKVEKWEKWLEYQKSSILESPLVLSEKNDFELGDYRIEQLKRPTAILEEGEAMSHCVADEYLHECIEGKFSIWSVWKITEDTDTKKRLATISVTSENAVEEFRGKCNMEPLRRVKETVIEWTRQEGIEYKG